MVVSATNVTGGIADVPRLLSCPARSLPSAGFGRAVSQGEPVNEARACINSNDLLPPSEDGSENLNVRFLWQFFPGCRNQTETRPAPRPRGPK